MIEVRAVQILTGVALLTAVLTGRIALFVRPWFIPVVAGTGVLLVVAALRTRENGRLTFAASGLVLLPLLAGASLTPDLVGRMPPPGAESAGAAIESRLGETHNPLLAGAGGEVTLLQVSLAERRLGAAALDGRAVVLEAMVADGQQLSRLVMVCCAADARPVTLRASGPLPPAGSWVRAAGTLTADGNVLVLQLDAAYPIDTPKDPLL